jgi:hypothetical protein
VLFTTGRPAIQRATSCDGPAAASGVGDPREECVGALRDQSSAARAGGESAGAGLGSEAGAVGARGVRSESVRRSAGSRRRERLRYNRCEFVCEKGKPTIARAPTRARHADARSRSPAHAAGRRPTLGGGSSGSAVASTSTATASGGVLLNSPLLLASCSSCAAADAIAISAS